MVILVLTRLLFFLQSPDLSCCITAARLMGSFLDRTDKQEAEISPKQMKECDTRICSGATEMAQ